MSSAWTATRSITFIEVTAYTLNKPFGCSCGGLAFLVTSIFNLPNSIIILPAFMKLRNFFIEEDSLRDFTNILYVNERENADE